MEMRRKDRALNHEDAMQLLQNAEYGVLATVSEEGMPYGVPMNFALDENTIYMHCAKAESHKISNIRNSEKASFTVVGNTELLPESFATKYMSAIAFGNIEIAESEQEQRKALEDILKKYSPDYMEAGMQYIDKAIESVFVLKLEIKEVSGKGRTK